MSRHVFDGEHSAGPRFLRAKTTGWEFDGGPHVYRGSDGIRRAYGAFYAVGGIHLLHCSVIDDGVACGVEFIAVGWGPRPFEPQAGIGIYERGRTGRLHAARVYDDVDVDLGLQ